MRRLWLLIPMMGLAGMVHADDPLYLSPDVPTTTAGGTTLLPWQIFRYDAVGPIYTLELTVPGEPDVDAVHRMDEPGDWLLSVDAPNDLAGALPGNALPGDVILFDSSAATYSLCFSGAAIGVPAGTNVDAVYLEGGDQGNLIVSFDVPTQILPFVGPLAFEPGDLVRFAPLGPGVCPGWALAAANPAFDASAAGAGVPLSSNVHGADDATGATIFSLDVPTPLAPPGPTLYVPGQIVASDTLGFSLFEPLLGWPISSQVDGLSCDANPGRVPVSMTVAWSATPGDLTISWQPSCSQGGVDYGIYEGALGAWYSHQWIDCNDGGAPLTEDITPAAGDSYYLVVPHNGKEEGSYGNCSAGACLAADERPAGGPVCLPGMPLPQVITPCP